MTEPLIGHLVVGPQQHGVVAFACELAGHLGGPVLRLPRRLLGATSWDVTDEREPSPMERLVATVDVVHVQFTDALYADRCDRAAQRFAEMRSAIEAPVTVTLHDLPDPGDAADRYARRCAAYRRVVSQVDAVVVNSEHESQLLGTVLGRPPAAHVIPLPIQATSATGRLPRAHPLDAGTIGLLGFVHPGKGYAEAIEELAAVPGPLTVTALGRAAEGHGDLPPILESLTAQAGHHWKLTGFLADDDMADRLRRVAVPLAPNPHVSASGSLTSWLAAGRRPLVADGGYARELGERLPGAVNLYRPGGLAAAVNSVLADPSSAWLDDDIRPGPDGAAAARAYQQVLAAVC